MWVRIRRIPAVKTGFVFASLYLVLVLVIGLPIFLIVLASTAGRSSAFVIGQTVGAFIGALVIYPLLGFVFGAALALAYNLTVRWTGGLEMLLETPAPAGPYQSPWTSAGPWTETTQTQPSAPWTAQTQSPPYGPFGDQPRPQDEPPERRS